jgi:hypothetical protein
MIFYLLINYTYLLVNIFRSFYNVLCLADNCNRIHVQVELVGHEAVLLGPLAPQHRQVSSAKIADVVYYLSDREKYISPLYSFLGSCYIRPCRGIHGLKSPGLIIDNSTNTDALVFKLYE